MAGQTPKKKKPVKASARDDAGAPAAQHPAEDAIDQAQHAAEALKTETDGDGAFNLRDFGAETSPAGPDRGTLSLLNDVDLNVKVELGRTRMYVEDVLRLNENSVIELDKAAGDPVDIYVNDRPVARGEVLVVNDNFCVRVSEIIQPLREESGPAT